MFMEKEPKDMISNFIFYSVRKATIGLDSFRANSKPLPESSKLSFFQCGKIKTPCWTSGARRSSYSAIMLYLISVA